MPKKKGNKLREPYRLLLLRDDTLAEVGSYRLSLLNIYIAVSALLIVTTALVLALIFLTPLRRLVPGYANVYESREYRELNKQVLSLEAEMENQRLYVDRFRNLLTGLPADDSIVASADNGVSTPPRPQSITDPGPAAQAPLSSPEILNFGDSSHEPPGTRSLYVIPPLRGIVSASFDPHTSHYGTDLLAPANTPVVSILDGTVVFADWTLETGNTIAIQHTGNMVSLYKHNSSNLKRLGAHVKAGEAVAIIGNTGETTSGPHLHFEIWIDGKPVDPEIFINF
jgi:murein DD-endopeptidase MepM/ murein hydrolase activator NlpD